MIVVPFESAFIVTECDVAAIWLPEAGEFATTMATAGLLEDHVSALLLALAGSKLTVAVLVPPTEGMEADGDAGVTDVTGVGGR